MRMTMLAALTAIAVAGGASTAAADVTLMRGSFVETVPTGGASAQTAVMHGGRALPARATPTAPAARPTAVAVRRAVASGSVLWLVDEGSGRVQACWLRGTGYAGENGIVCTAP